MSKIIGIVKLENGNVRLIDQNGIDKTMDGSSIITPLAGVDSIQVRQQNNEAVYIKRTELQYTQILPGASVPFDPDVSTLQDLQELLDTDFFFELAGSGGGENPADEILKYTAQTIGAVTVDVADFAPEDGQMVSLEVIFQGRTTDGFQWFAKRYRSTTREGANVFFTTQNSSVTINTIGTATDGNINVVGSLGLRLQVTGVAGKTTDWKITVKKYTINN